jgi:UDP:flavonoid glycosyltransferase YjiC (YdhE family)
VTGRLRVFLGAFGEPGHAFPMMAIGRALVARGHEVTYETWSRWREHVEAEGMRFVPAPEYPVFPTMERPLQPYEAVVRATAETRVPLHDAAPDVVVHDILTLAPAMAAELEGVAVATLIPHVYPAPAPGLPPYALGARLPRTTVGGWLWRSLASPVEAGLRRGRAELNETRRKLGLAPVDRLHGGLSAELCIVGTFPQLEYPRPWPESVHVVGPLMWEPPYHDVAAPEGSDPLVLVAPSTAQDPENRLLECALRGLADEPVRLLAATNRKPLRCPVPVPANARLVDWLSYSRTMPQCALVLTNAGHGTLVRALSCGCPVVAVPHAGDMGENAARADWAGVAVRLPWRFLSPSTLRLAVRRALEDVRLPERARSIAAWSAAHDGAVRAAELVEALAQRGAAQSGRCVRTNSISSGASP